MKTIKLGKIIKPIKRKDVYKFEVKFMYGDADGYGSEIIYVEKNNPYLERFIDFLDNCEKAYPNGRGGYDDYNDKVVKDWWLFAMDYWNGDESEEERKEKERESEECGIFLRWHMDPCGDGIMASYEWTNITFFNEYGVEFEVIIE
jgi:hypothetical protein